MPKLRIPTQEFSVSGTPIEGRRANAGDFGVTGIEGIADKVSASFSVIQDNADRANVSDIHAKLAQARAEWTVALRERAQGMQPGDTTFLPKFDADFQKYLGETEQNIVTSEAGRMVFQKTAADMRAHFFEQAGVMQAKAVGAKAVQDFGVMVDSSVRLATLDPTQTDMMLKQVRDAINDPNGFYAKVPGPERAALLRKAEEDVTYGGAKGLVIRDPQLALKKLNNGDYANVNPKRLDDLLVQAKQGVDHLDVERRKNEAEARLRAAEASSKEKDEFVKRILDPKANGGMPTRQQIAGATNLTPEDRENVYGFMKRAVKEMEEGGTRKNLVEVERLSKQLYLGADDPDKIYTDKNIVESYHAGKINRNEYLSLRGEVDRLKDGSTNKLQREVNSSIGRVQRAMQNAVGARWNAEEVIVLTQNFADEVNAQVDKFQRENPNKNPRVMLDAKNPESPFYPANLSRLMKTPTEALADGASAVKDKARSPAKKEVSGKIGGAPAQTTYTDAEKEKRYQEWKAKQK